MINLSKNILPTLGVIMVMMAPYSSVKAQNYDSARGSNIENKNFRLGLAINPNLGWYRYTNENYNSGTKMGFSYGLLADLGFANNYYFSTGFLINSIGSSLNSELTENRDFIRLQYIDIPLTVKLKSEENEMGRFYGQFGFTAGIKVAGKEKITGARNSTAIQGADIFRLGLQIGGGAEWKLNNNLSLLTGLSFNNGFSRAINNSGKPKTSYLALNIGILF
ncbi:outer membrane beta-barrel protein [Sphingobacterium rhinopitheci]|uniref:outer membrane beta-barrel protein n=1 Tax=Sphingobacterium rhinopitheci TaxID=2781960 RepID=UPI001F51E130|nr:outer membrane beta-barrel protein [Sphingobacterium rhinopitheci]MCI0920901.1 PorT family protein [Sphingobacterium rhinopitheci]